MKPMRQRRGLVAGAGDHAGVGDDLVPSQWTPRPIRLIHLCVQQLGHEVIGRVACAPVDVVGEHGQDGVERRLIEGDRCAVGRDQLISGLAVRVLIRLGYPEQEANGPQRDLDTELADDVELVSPEQRVERARRSSCARAVRDRACGAA